MYYIVYIFYVTVYNIYCIYIYNILLASLVTYNIVILYIILYYIEFPDNFLPLNELQRESANFSLSLVLRMWHSHGCWAF